MIHTGKLTGTLALGAGLMYLLDPSLGRTRRSRLQAQAARLGRRCGHAVKVGARDGVKRTAGLLHETMTHRSPEAPSDHLLRQRVRSRLGHLVSHPRAVRVEALNGRVILSGPVLRHEHDRVVHGIGRVHGVKMLEDQLEAHAAATHVPALQDGGDARRGPRWLGRTEAWPPRWRLAVGAVGTFLAAFGGSRAKTPLGVTVGLGGALLLARGLTNAPLRRLSGGGGRVVAIEKVLNIHAPLAQVFAAFSDLPALPRFLSHVRDIQDRGGGRYHWVVDGPAGLPVAWNAVVTQRVTGEVIAWQSEPGSAVASSGTVAFQPNDDGGTRVHVRLAYSPVAGLIGHGLARLFRVDPKRQMNDDLASLKAFLETGDAATRPAKSQFYH